MTDYDQQLKRNKALARGAEQGLTYLVRAGAGVFRIILNFLKDMVRQVFGR
jgi:hypothetical protein